MKFGLKIGAPNEQEQLVWGDYYFAESLGKQLKECGYDYEIYTLDKWDTVNADRCDIIIHLRGLSKCKLRKHQLNIMWNISHPDDVNVKEYNKYDIVFIASQVHREQLIEKVRVPIYVAEQFVDTKKFREIDCQKDIDILFVGNTRGQYREIVRHAIEMGLRVDVYGLGWEMFIDSQYIKGTWIDSEHLVEMYSRSKIVLNDHWIDMKDKGFLNNRFYEATACGAIVINDNIRLANNLNLDTIRYTKPEELRDLIRGILQEYDRYYDLNKRVQKYVCENYNIENVVQHILSTIAPYSVRKLQKKYIKGAGLRHKVFRLKLEVKIKKEIRKAKKIRLDKKLETINTEVRKIKIGFWITEKEEIQGAGDKYPAIGIGYYLEQDQRYEVSYYTRTPELTWINTPKDTDYIIIMTPEGTLYNLNQYKAKKIAWIRGNYKNWKLTADLSKVDEVITSSEILRKKILGDFPSIKCRGVVNLGVPIDIEEEALNIMLDYTNQSRPIDVCFVGNVYNERPITFNLDLSNDIRFEFYGNKNDSFSKWDKYHKGLLKHEDLFKTYSKSKIVIEDIATENKGTVNLRIFEAAASGALVICNYDEALLEIFGSDKIIMYKSKDELNERIAFFLREEHERERYARALHKEVMKNHTFKKRYIGFKKCILDNITN